MVDSTRREFFPLFIRFEYNNLLKEEICIELPTDVGRMLNLDIIINEYRNLLIMFRNLYYIYDQLQGLNYRG